MVLGKVTSVVNIFKKMGGEVISYVKSWCMSNLSNCVELGELLSEAVKGKKKKLLKWLENNPDFTNGLIKTANSSGATQDLADILGVDPNLLTQAISKGTIIDFIESSADKTKVILDPNSSDTETTASDTETTASDTETTASDTETNASGSTNILEPIS